MKCRPHTFYSAEKKSSFLKIKVKIDLEEPYGHFTGFTCRATSTQAGKASPRIVVGMRPATLIDRTLSRRGLGSWVSVDDAVKFSPTSRLSG